MIYADKGHNISVLTKTFLNFLYIFIDLNILHNDVLILDMFLNHQLLYEHCFNESKSS